MILSVGEILADMIGDEQNRFSACCGGAPFNVAVGAKRAGAKVAFVGKVGRDVIGDFLIDKALSYGLDKTDISIDSVRNTTLAFVALKDGERNFTFFRHDTADYNLSIDDIDFNAYPNLRILHVGSLMLSEPCGRELAKALFKKGKELGVKISFDVNFRDDLYESREEAARIFAPFVKSADLLKLSEDELEVFCGEGDIASAITKLDNQLIVVTEGAKGCAYRYKGKVGEVNSRIRVKPLDTTGAGDAFFGALLAALDTFEPITEELLVRALDRANTFGAEATQHFGAI